MDIDSILTTLLRFIPPSYVATATAIVSFIIASCALAMRFWKPPARTSRWLVVYQLVSALAQARGWNSSAYQPDRKALMVPVTTDRTQAAADLGMDVGDTRPR